MARDPDRNTYITVGIPKHSALLKRLQADAEATGASIGHVLVLRASDWYNMPFSLTAPGTSDTTQAGSGIAQQAQNALGSSTLAMPQKREDEEGQIQARRNAEAALEAWT